MESRIVKLKSDFNNIISIRTTVKNVFDILQIRIDKLHQIYSEFINNNKSDIFVFGLDSFHFQSKLIDIEYDDMKRLFLAINNRMYCEYFKLHKIIVDYISKNINDKRAIELIKINNYPIYKDLEPFKEYKFELMLDIHDNILNLLGIIISLINNKENELLLHKTKQNIGLNIDNFITTFNFNINVMKEKVLMFITYIEFFHKMHTKYLKRFSNKIQLIYTHINNDIKFDDTVEVSKNKKKELIDELVKNDIDSVLLKDIKISIGSETNSENSSENSNLELASESIINFENFNSIVNPEIKYDNTKLSVSTLNTLSEKSEIEKSSLKTVFKKNVHKVSNMLKLFKSKPDKIYNPKLLDNDLNNIFSGINKSCDSIIENNQNIGFNIENLDLNDKKNEFMNFDTDKEENNIIYDNNLREELKVDDEEEVKVDEEEVKVDEEEVKVDEEEEMKVDEEEVKVDEEEVKVDEEEVKVDEEEVIKVDEEVIKVDEEVIKVDEEVIKVDEEVIKVDEEEILEPTAKKKRIYNRKKKA